MDDQSFFYNGSSGDLCTPEDAFCRHCTSYPVVVPTDTNYNISRDKNMQQFSQRGFQITWSIPDSCLSCNATGGTCYHHIKKIGREIDNFDAGDFCICRHGLYLESNCSEGHHAVGQVLSPGVTAEKLGKGGFGTVYKGQLPTGREIAVKILDESKQSEQQFIAEVATVGTTCHVNLMRLLGYSSQGSIKALVYEYMVNGSLDKYIHGGHHDELSWKQLYSIALGTARGIAYLHDECRNRILHFDIKPHNVLLDDTFCPKVADFGLAQITNREESHISVGYRGTLGYSAPEMVSRMYGVVTDRSDVYSYGMLVMEMVGARQNIDFHNKESTSSKFFYPEWAFKQVEKGQFGNLRKGNMSEEEQRIAKSLSLVGLWCIQFNAVRRPPMSKVIEMLEEDAGITTPPYPFPVDPPMIEMHLDDSDPSSSTITTPTPFPFPIDPPMTTMQHHAPSCSATYPLEVEKKNPKSTHNAQT